MNVLMWLLGVQTDPILGVPTDPQTQDPKKNDEIECLKTLIATLLELSKTTATPFEDLKKSHVFKNGKAENSFSTKVDQVCINYLIKFTRESPVRDLQAAIKQLQPYPTLNAVRLLEPPKTKYLAELEQILANYTALDMEIDNCKKLLQQSTSDVEKSQCIQEISLLTRKLPLKVSVEKPSNQNIDLGKYLEKDDTITALFNIQLSINYKPVGNPNNSPLVLTTPQEFTFVDKATNKHLLSNRKLSYTAYTVVDGLEKPTQREGTVELKLQSLVEKALFVANNDIHLPASEKAKREVEQLTRNAAPILF